MVTTGADPQKEMKEIQLEGAPENGNNGEVSEEASLAGKREREQYNRYMADQVSEFYKGGQKRNE